MPAEVVLYGFYSKVKKRFKAWVKRQVANIRTTKINPSIEDTIADLVDEARTIESTDSGPGGSTALVAASSGASGNKNSRGGRNKGRSGGDSGGNSGGSSRKNDKCKHYRNKKHKSDDCF